MKTRAADPEKNDLSKTKTNGKHTMDYNTDAFRDLFVDELRDIYWAEKALIKVIPKMIKNSTDEKLEEALAQHLEASMGHLTRLERVFSLLDRKATAVKCEAMAGLVKETKRIIKETEKGVIRDAGIISSAQKVEHYEIAAYTTLHSFAKTLGEEEVAGLLHETLVQEQEADELLSRITESIQLETVDGSASTMVEP
ncbi:MAG TPA: ferritin-like domain-containing protein [Cyclobacteriaceae bacterium]|jgi:ferritin-like metal-binding protein YciE|nr:ferritin-like domain-containing protein [Cyclobacteriaceae bacterium]